MVDVIEPHLAAARRVPLREGRRVVPQEEEGRHERRRDARTCSDRRQRTTARRAGWRTRRGVAAPDVAAGVEPRHAPRSSISATRHRTRSSEVAAPNGGTPAATRHRSLRRPSSSHTSSRSASGSTPRSARSPSPRSKMPPEQLAKWLGNCPTSGRGRDHHHPRAHRADPPAGARPPAVDAATHSFQPPPGDTT